MLLEATRNQLIPNVSRTEVETASARLMRISVAQGRAESRAAGRAEGRAEGHARGRAQGHSEAMLKIARDVCSPEEFAALERITDVGQLEAAVLHALRSR